MENVETKVAEVKSAIESLNENSKLSDVIAKMNEIITKLNETKVEKVRNRGPESQREMTEDDARRIISGDLKSKSHKDAAIELKLSYGQVYSARNGFTFKAIHKEIANSK